MNLSAAQALFDQLRDTEFAAFPHSERSLRLGIDRTCSIRIEHYLVKDERLVFQFPYPRRTRLSDFEFRIMASLMHYGYVTRDFEQASIEIADLSAPDAKVRIDGRWESGPRVPRIIEFSADQIISRDVLQDEIHDVYGILMRIADEAD